LRKERYESGGGCSCISRISFPRRGKKSFEIDQLLEEEERTKEGWVHVSILAVQNSIKRCKRDPVGTNDANAHSFSGLNCTGHTKYIFPTLKSHVSNSFIIRHSETMDSVTGQVMKYGRSKGMLSERALDCIFEVQSLRGSDQSYRVRRKAIRTSSPGPYRPHLAIPHLSPGLYRRKSKTLIKGIEGDILSNTSTPCPVKEWFGTWGPFAARLFHPRYLVGSFP
jgi:hypothetical protein